MNPNEEKVVLKTTQADLDTLIGTQREEAIKEYKTDLIEKGFNPDTIEEEIKRFQTEGQVNSGVTLKEPKRFPIGRMANAIAKAHNSGKTPLQLMKDHADMTNDNSDLKLTLNVMEKTYQSNDGNRLAELHNEAKTIGISSLLDGGSSMFGLDLEVDKLLRDTSVLFQIEGAKNRQLVNGEYKRRVQTSGTTGYWVGEAEGPTKSKAQYETKIYRAKMVAGFTDITKASILLGNANQDREAQEELIESISEMIDQTFFSGKGTEFQPKGISTLTGKVSQQATASATALQVGQDLDNLYGTMAGPTNKIKFRNPYYLGTELQRVKYAGMTSANGVIMPYAKDLNSLGILGSGKFLSSNAVSNDNKKLYLIDCFLQVMPE